MSKKEYSLLAIPILPLIFVIIIGKVNIKLMDFSLVWLALSCLFLIIFFIKSMT